MQAGLTGTDAMLYITYALILVATYMILKSPKNKK